MPKTTRFESAQSARHQSAFAHQALPSGKPRPSSPRIRVRASACATQATTSESATGRKSAYQ